MMPLLIAGVVASQPDGLSARSLGRHEGDNPLRSLERQDIDPSRPLLFLNTMGNQEAEHLFSIRQRLCKMFGNVRILAFVRPPLSLMTTRFVNTIKYHEKPRLDPDWLWPAYRKTISNLDRVFGAEKVTLRFVSDRALEEGRVKEELRQELGAHLADTAVHCLQEHCEERFSLEATAVLFAYRKFGVRYRPYDAQWADNEAFIRSLHGFGKTKFRLAGPLIEPIIERNQADIDWVTARLRRRLCDELWPEVQFVSDERDLFTVAISVVRELGRLFEVNLEATAPTPQQVANWMEKLRVAATGRTSTGGKPFERCSGFFSERQREFLASDTIGPAMALRELALSFERVGRLAEAKNCLRAARKLRPDVQALAALHEQLVRKDEGGV